MGRVEESIGSKDSRRTLREARSVKQKLRSVTRASASRDVCHILPVKKPRRGFDGKFVRPIGRPPVEGFVWDSVGGFWIPRGSRSQVESPPKKAESSSSSESSDTDDGFIVQSESRIVLPKASEQNKATDSRLIEKSDHRSTPVGSRRSPKSRSVSRAHASANIRQKDASRNHDESNSLHDMHTGPRATDDRKQAKTIQPEKIELDKMHKSKRKKTSFSCDRKATSDPQNDIFHPDSTWRELKPLDGSMLTLYERHRKPRTVPKGIHKCALKILKQEFRCVICLGYIRNARVVKECLHRFCEQCIEKALIQVGRRNECPICRVFIPSRRSLASDPNFDKLVQCILKDFAIEQEKEAFPMPFNLSADSRARTLQQAIRNKRLAVAEQKKTENTTAEIIPDKDKALVNNENRVDLTHDNSHNSVVKQSAIVKLRVCRLESENLLDELRQPYLTISGDTPVKLLRGFLERKLNCPRLQISVRAAEGKDVIIKDWKTAEEMAITAMKTLQNSIGNYVTIYYSLVPI